MVLGCVDLVLLAWFGSILGDKGVKLALRQLGPGAPVDVVAVERLRLLLCKHCC